MKNSVKDEMARWIKAVRLEQGLSQRKASAKTGLSRRQIAKYESGRPIPLFRMVQLFSGYRVNPQVVVTKILQVQNQARLSTRPKD